MTTPTGVLFYDPQSKPLDVTGNFQAGCYLYFFSTGTLNQTNVYADGALQTPLSQPVTADSAGRFVPIYMDPGVIYHVQLFNAGGTKLEDVDPFVPTPIPAAITTLQTDITSIQSQLSTLQSTVTGLQTSASWSALTGIPAPITALAASTPPDTQQTFWRDDGTWAAPAILGAPVVGVVASQVTGIGTSYANAISTIPVVAGYTYAAYAEVEFGAAAGVTTFSAVLTPNTGSLTALGDAVGSTSQGSTGNDITYWAPNASNLAAGISAQSCYANVTNEMIFRGRFTVGAGVTSLTLQIKAGSGSTSTVNAGSFIALTLLAT